MDAEMPLFPTLSLMGGLYDDELLLLEDDKCPTLELDPCLNTAVIEEDPETEQECEMLRATLKGRQRSKRYSPLATKIIKGNREPDKTAANSVGSTHREAVKKENRDVSSVRVDERFNVEKNKTACKSKGTEEFEEEGVLSRNAIAARENRQRKKKYVENLECAVRDLQSGNAQLSVTVASQEETIKTLASENAYLRNVLANVDEISALIKNIRKIPGSKFATSLLKQENKGNATIKRPLIDDSQERSGIMIDNKRNRRMDSTSDHEYASSLVYEDGESVSSSDAASPVGVCLHVSSGMVSLEFCPTCNQNVADIQREEEDKF